MRHLPVESGETFPLCGGQVDPLPLPVCELPPHQAEKVLQVLNPPGKQCSGSALVSMRIRLQDFRSMRIRTGSGSRDLMTKWGRIQTTKINGDPDLQHCLTKSHIPYFIVYNLITLMLNQNVQGDTFFNLPRNYVKIFSTELVSPLICYLLRKIRGAE